MPRRLLSAAAASVLVLCSLAACGDEKGESITDPPPDLGIESPSDGGGQEPSDGGGGGDGEEPTADAPDIPAPDPADFAGMDENTPEGAEQAFRYYIATVMWAHQTGNSDPLIPLQNSDCKGCEEFMETFRELQEHRQLWEQFSLNDVAVEYYDSDTYDYEVTYDFTTTPHVRPSDDFSDKVNVGELEYMTAGGMDWDGENWVVSELSAKWGDDVLTN